MQTYYTLLYNLQQSRSYITLHKLKFEENVI